MPRLFVAVDPAPECRARLARLQQDLRGRLKAFRWVAPERFHLTLAFLGEVEPSRLAELRAALASLASCHPTTTLDLHGLGGFPTRARARVLWVGLKPRGAGLEGLVRDLRGELVARRFSPGFEAFQPHITLARAQGRWPARLGPALDGPGEGGWGSLEVGDLCLMESALAPRASEIRILERFPLAGEALHPA